MFNNFSDNKYSTVLTIALIVVIILIFLLLGFWAYSEYMKYDSKSSAEKAGEEFSETVTKPTNTKNNNTVDETITNAVNPFDSISSVEPTSTTTTSNTKQTYKGFVMVGRIEIPKTKVDLPVLEETTKKSIEESVAVLYGPGLNKVGNTVIVGHNYKDGRFFANNAKISNGDKIYITDTSGNKVTYIVYDTFVTTPEDAEYMTRDTAGKREISLSTCTDDTKGRIIVLAREE